MRYSLTFTTSVSVSRVTVRFVVIWLYCRDMAKIEGLELVYQNHVAKSAVKCRYHEDFWFESRSPVTHYPKNSKNFWNFFHKFLQINNYNPVFISPLMALLIKNCFFSTPTNLNESDIWLIQYGSYSMSDLLMTNMRCWWQNKSGTFYQNKSTNFYSSWRNCFDFNLYYSNALINIKLSKRF